MIHRIALYLRLMRSQLRDRNAERPMSWRQRLWRGHRLGTCALTLLQTGPPYKPPRWMRR